jgi:hypothetical protein
MWGPPVMPLGDRVAGAPWAPQHRGFESIPGLPPGKERLPRGAPQERVVVGIWRRGPALCGPPPGPMRRTPSPLFQEAKVPDKIQRKYAEGMAKVQ